jgi:hypothetical protein
VSLLVLLGLSCEQYEYSSPLPGILDVRLRVKNNRQSLLPFGGQNEFRLNLRKLEARKDGNIILPIYADLRAIQRNPDGDIFNCLDVLTRDSAFILGQAYAPPGVFSILDLTIDPRVNCSAGISTPCVMYYNGFFLQPIIVEIAPEATSFQRLPGEGQPPLNIVVEERRLTRVTVTLDLDSTLVRKANTYEYRPKLYVSSIQIF